MPFLFLPLFEIIGFIVIGGKIGLIDSLLWLMLSTTLGFYLLQSGGLRTLKRAQEQTAGDEFFAVQNLFDELCLMIAALLLIFPRIHQ